ncbi:hypothetical protein [Variovorax sp. Sphag1AA]|uniref:hypothetical protein n=1 Tax=Variovorax sp. Sphag1AA TaxID=2587027 RepID=UPI0016226CB1|nr:hypothetical protein [Variovorax sp. Sphag1AA]MBB3175885.1 hypothetical protein [Variovorax sp. Sphag1AA]
MSMRGRPPSSVRESLALARLVKSNDLAGARSFAVEVLRRQRERDAELTKARASRTDPDPRRR